MSVLLQTQGLGVSFGGVHAVKAVDFTLDSGELRCLIGPNGAGKSTFFKLLSGQLKPTHGTCHFQTKRISGLAPHRIARIGIGIKTQTPSVFDGLDVFENLRLAASRNQTAEQARQTAENTLQRIDMSEHRHRLVGDLAHGQRQWVELGMILASRPTLVLLDEPAAGMTYQEVRKTAALIKEINAHSTVVVVEHDMEFIRLIAGTVTVFNQGAILAQGSFTEVTQNPLVRDAYLGKQEIQHA